MSTLSAESVIWTHESICWFNFTQHASQCSYFIRACAALETLHRRHYTTPCLYKNLHSKLHLAPKIWGNSYLPGLRALISSLRLEIPGVINSHICFIQLILMTPLSPAGQCTVCFFVTPGSAVAPDNSPPSASLTVFTFVPYSISLIELHPSGLS